MPKFGWRLVSILRWRWDPTDKDILTVRPDPLMDGIFLNWKSRGYAYVRLNVKLQKGFALPFVQEFEFVPTTGPFHGRWREVGNCGLSRQGLFANVV